MSKTHTIIRKILHTVLVTVLGLVAGCSGSGGVSTSGGVLDPGSGDLHGSGNLAAETWFAWAVDRQPG